MQAYRVEATIASDGSLTIADLPLPVGASVEVIILLAEPPTALQQPYPLHGLPVIFHDPFEPVAQDDWSTLHDHP